jgi:hypothetical protein
MLIKLLALAVALAASLPAAAQHSVGNGGIGFRCRKPDGSLKLYVADGLYGMMSWGHTPDLGPENLSWEDKVEIALGRIPSQDALRKSRLRIVLRDFKTHVRFIDSSLLHVTSDYLRETAEMRQIITPFCIPVQLANLTCSRGKPDIQWIVSRDGFEELSSDERALLVLHEIIYEHWLESGGESLEPVYFLVSFLASSAPEHTPPERYRELLRGMGWPVGGWREGP